MGWNGGGGGRRKKTPDPAWRPPPAPSTFLLELALGVAFLELPLPADLGAAFFALLLGVFVGAGTVTGSGCTAKEDQGGGSSSAGRELVGGGWTAVRRPGGAPDT
jgi:hypothetical protein